MVHSKPIIYYFIPSCVGLIRKLMNEFKSRFPKYEYPFDILFNINIQRYISFRFSGLFYKLLELVSSKIMIYGEF